MPLNKASEVGKQRIEIAKQAILTYVDSLWKISQPPHENDTITVY